VSILAHRAFVRATVTNFFFFASLNGFVLLPLYIEQLGGTPAEIGIVMGLYSAVGIVVQPLLGPWIDALGRRPFMRLGVALVLASAVLALGTGSTGWLALVRILQGIGFSAFFVANFSHVVDLVPAPERGRALGLYGVSGLLSTALAPLLGEWVVRRFGFRAWFVACAGLAGVAGALVWPIRARARSTAVEPRVGAWMRAGLVELFRRPMAVTLVFGLGAGALFAFLPTFAEQLGVRTLALFYTAYAGAAMAVRVAAGRLIDTHGRRAVIVPSMFVQAGAVALLAVLGVAPVRLRALPVLAVLVLAGLLAGGAHGFLYPGLAALVTDDAPASQRGAVIGVFSAVFLAGNAAGAVVFGGVASWTGYGPMWGVLAVLLLAGGVVSLRLPAGGPG
jgi:MFS family permease